jgi:hypothetical protein
MIITLSDCILRPYPSIIFYQPAPSICIPFYWSLTFLNVRHLAPWLPFRHLGDRICFMETYDIMGMGPSVPEMDTLEDPWL